MIGPAMTMPSPAPRQIDAESNATDERSRELSRMIAKGQWETVAGSLNDPSISMTGSVVASALINVRWIAR